WAYRGFLVLAAACAGVLWWTGRTVPAEKTTPREDETVTVGRRLRWVVLAFIPSSLLLSVTTFLTTDLAAIPLLWVVPLALYLLTFTLTFARRPLLPHRWMVRLLPPAVIAVVLSMLAEATEPLVLLLVVHLAALFIVAMVCHGELARLRPEPQHLTAFYLCLSLGGVLGGVFNS